MTLHKTIFQNTKSLRGKVRYLLAFGIVCISSLTPLDVFAKQAVYDAEFFAKNNILFYNPNDTCTTNGGTQTELAGGDNREKIWNYLTAHGLSPEQAAGVVGNIQTESGQTFSPTINEFSQTFPGGGYGIVQWTGGRRDNVVASLTASYPDLMEKYYKVEYSSVGAYTDQASGFLSKNTVTGELMPVEDNDKLLIAQLDFLVTESTSRTLHSPAVAKGYGTDADKEWDTLKKQTTVADASNVWVYSFEIPADIDATAAARVTNAQAIFDMYSGNTSTTGTSGDCGDVGGDKKQLAADILATDNLYYDPGIMDVEKSILPDIASGKNNGNDWPCGMNINILKALAAITKEHRIRANSLNRACSNDIPSGSGTYSRHYAGNGSAIDFGPIDSLSAYSVDGANLIIKYMAPFLVNNSGIGQVTGYDGEFCVPTSSLTSLPAGIQINRFADGCTHLHVDVPPNSDPNLKCKAGVSYGGCDEANQV